MRMIRSRAHRQARRQAHQPGEGLLPGSRADEGRPDPLLPRRRPTPPPPRAAAPHADAALPGRGGRFSLLPEARPRAASGLARHRPHPLSLRPDGRLSVCNDDASLAWIVNLGCIDLHTWRSRVDDVERPDELLIDLDPSEGNPWSSVQRIALVVREVMDELGLASFPKTSGATGLHILCPIRPELRFLVVRDFAKALAKEVEGRIDDQSVATTTWKVADRRGVFVDYGQNARDRTIASAYSIRPTPDARASAPLSWDEVAEVDPAQFTLETMRERVTEAGDPSVGMWRRKVSLLPRFESLGLKKPASG